MILQLQEVLKRFGWTDYEVRAYAALVKEGALTATDLSISANIPDARIHGILKKLGKRGTVKKLGGRPAIFDAQHPREVLESEMKELRVSTQEAIATTEQMWETRLETKKGLEKPVWTLNSIKGVVNQARELIRNSKTSFTIIDDELKWLGRKDLDTLEKMIEKGGVVKIVGTGISRSVLERLANIGAIVKEVSKIGSRCCVADHSTILWCTDSSSGSVIVDENLATILEGNFEKEYGGIEKLEVERVDVENSGSSPSTLRRSKAKSKRKN